MNNWFEGMYYKHQKGERTISLIAGISAGSHGFIQVITNGESFYFRYPLALCRKAGSGYHIGGSVFSDNGVKLRVEENNAVIHGEITYRNLTPIGYDIMGPFKLLPMQCRHKITSLYHDLDGKLTVNGEATGFTGGVGYIEGDSGVSFPGSYAWFQWSGFPERICVTASAADIPLAMTRFGGCICIVYLDNTQYRLATYLGAKILYRGERGITLSQGRLRLQVEVDEGVSHKLLAPQGGKMTREIRERIICGARIRFMEGAKILLDKQARNASFEFVG